MANTFDVIVMGTGGMGSATAYHLARRHQRVLALDRFGPPHDRGSSHGRSRVIRQAYFEHPAYVPLVLRAYELWRELEQNAGKPLLRLTGGLMIGRPESAVVSGSLLSARQYNLEHELLDSDEIARRYRQFRVPAGFVALYEKMLGILNPEATITAHIEGAVAAGAHCRFDEPVASWQATGDHVVVRTTKNEYRAAHLVITVGPWVPALLAQLGLPLKVERVAMFWFAPTGSIEPFLPARFPVHLWQLDDGVIFYGMPALEGPADGVKVAFHNIKSACSPDTVDRQVDKQEVEQMRAYLRHYVPELAGECIQTATCMYTMTPDEHFIVGPHPHHPQVVIAAGFSGHGYKFASVLGEAIADLVTDGETAHPIGFLSPSRFSTERGG